MGDAMLLDMMMSNGYAAGYSSSDDDYYEPASRPMTPALKLFFRVINLYIFVGHFQFILLFRFFYT